MIKTGTRNFWIAQLIGWGLFATVNFIMQSISFGTVVDYSLAVKQAFVNSAIAFTTGVLITSAYRYLLRRSDLNLLKVTNVLFYILASTVILTLSFLLLANVLMYALLEQRMLTITEFFGNAFMFVILMLIWNSLYFMVHYLHSWKNAESEKWQLAAAMKEAQLGSLKAQINPHFMFNAINNIKALISEDPDRAKHMLMNFSDMFRYSLVHSDTSLVTVSEELEVVNKYLELLSIQFEDKLAYEIKADPLLLTKKIPPMVVQLLVENAVKHGISELAEGGKVYINVEDQGEEFLLRVSNNGSLQSPSKIQKKLGIGLQNIRKRLALIYGERTKLELSDKDGLVVAEIGIPMTLQKVAK